MAASACSIAASPPAIRSVPAAADCVRSSRADSVSAISAAYSSADGCSAGRGLMDLCWDRTACATASIAMTVARPVGDSSSEAS